MTTNILCAEIIHPEEETYQFTCPHCNLVEDFDSYELDDYDDGTIHTCTECNTKFMIINCFELED